MRQHDRSFLVSLEQRDVETSVFGHAVHHDRLQLTVIADDNHLYRRLEGAQRNETLRFHAHSALVDHQLTHVGATCHPGTDAGGARAQDHLVALQLLDCRIGDELCVLFDLSTSQQHSDVCWNGFNVRQHYEVI